MPLQFTNGLILILIPAACWYFWWQHRRTVTDMSPQRKRLSLLLRLLVVTALILTLAGTKLIRRGESLAVVFVVDGSRSVREDQRSAMEKYLSDASKGMRQVDRVGVITFAQDPHTQSSPGQPIDPSRLKDTGITTATDISQALRQARNELDSFAKDSGKRIVLLSDGNENSGRSLSEVPDLAAAHIQLDTLTVPVNLPKETLIEKTIIPARVKIGEPFPVRVVIQSQSAQTAKISLQRDGSPRGDAKSVTLHPGKNVVVFEQNIEKTGFFRYTTSLESPDDTIPENNRGEGFVWVRGKPTVLYVADDPSLTNFLRNALKSQNIDVDYAPAAAMPTSAAALQRYDSVFVSNVRASDFSLSQMTALQVSCRDFGIGFGMVGGESSFGAGGYRGTPIEETLPVTMDVKKQKRMPSVAVALVIEDLEIPSSVNMSIEAAKATMDLLEPIDMVGVLDCNPFGGFGGVFGGGNSGTSPAGTWRIQMQHVTDREALKAAMQNLTGMGDPPSYNPFLAEAARVLNGTDAKVKHIVFLGDGDAVFENNQNETASIIKKIRDMGITISTIASGTSGGGDVKFMATMAYLGGGQAYVADQPRDLPRLLLKDQQTISQPPIIEEPFRPRAMEGDEVFKGIDWGSAPLLLGYNISNLKLNADLSLISHRNDPIFAGWRYGLGRSVAFLSDDRAKWAAQWMSWPGYAKFWAQAVRWTLRPIAPSDYSTQVNMEGNRGHIVVDAIDEQGHFVNKLPLTARIAAPNTGGIKGTAAEQVSIRQTGPGHYEAWFDAPQIGTYLVNVLQAGADPKSPQKSTVVGMSTPYSPEYRETASNHYLMSQLAQAGGGRVDPQPSAVFGGDRPDVFSAKDLTHRLLMFSMLLLPFDIAVRRIALEKADLVKAWNWVFGSSRNKSKTKSATPELGRLLDRKSTADQSMQGNFGNGEHSVPQNLDSETAGIPLRAPAATSTRNEAIRDQTRTESGSKTLTKELEIPEAGTQDTEIQDKSNEEPSLDESGMSRLMAAKRRAGQRKDD